MSDSSDLHRHLLEESSYHSYTREIRPKMSISSPINDNNNNHDNNSATIVSHTSIDSTLSVQSTHKKHKSNMFLNEEDHSRYSTNKSRRADLATVEFYKQEHWFDELCEILFKVKERKTTISLEIYYGLIHFISCLYILAVAPQQLAKAGYDTTYTVVAIGTCCGIGSIVGGLFTNLPFVIAPTSVVSIFLSVSLQSNNLGSDVGSAAVLLSGIPLLFLFWRPLGIFVGKLIPLPIQVGTTLGVGLLTALAGAAEINIVQPGTYALLELGEVTPEVIIAVFGLLTISVGMYYHIKGAFVIGLISCSLLWWVSENDWPLGIASVPKVAVIQKKGFDGNVTELTFELVFLYILYLSGLIPTFTELSGLKREDGTTPRGRWFFIIAGLMTIMSGILTSAPVLISPESSAGIKAGAKTGLSTLVCGLLFLVTIFFSPIFQAVPAAATSPLLMMIGIILFQDVNRVNWKVIEDAAPAFVVLFFIPFTYSIINGVTIGYLVYIIIGIFTGSLKDRSIEMLEFYFPEQTKYFIDRLFTTTNNDNDGSTRHVNSEIGPYQSSDMEGSHHENSNLSATSEIINESIIISPLQTEVISIPTQRKERLSAGRIRAQTFTYDRDAIRSIENVNIS